MTDTASSKISVILPVFNAGCWLDPCLDSLAAQTHTNFGCILVDDGSTDGSGAVCDRRVAADPRFMVLHRPNSGVSAARVAGRRAADGAFITFLDADDLLAPRHLEFLLRALTESDLPVSCTAYHPFSGQAPAAAPDTAFSCQALKAPAHLEALLFDHRVDFALWNKLFRADALPQSALEQGCSVRFNEDLRVCWAALLPLDGVALTGCPTYYYRQNPASATHKALAPASITDQWAVARQIAQDCAGGPLAPLGQRFYFEKLLYLDSMILRQDNAADYAAQQKALTAALRELLPCAQSARHRALGLLAARLPGIYRQLCRLLLTDRR